MNKMPYIVILSPKEWETMLTGIDTGVLIRREEEENKLRNELEWFTKINYRIVCGFWGVVFVESPKINMN